MTGLGDGYFQKMKEEETENTAPVYDEDVEIVPSLETADAEMTYDQSPIYLSNKKHSDLGKLTDVAITLNAGYLPECFAEWATGAVEIGPGVHLYTSRPTSKFFRFAFPMTDENGDEVIANFPKCQLEPVGLNSQTEGESKDAQITAYSIVGNALIYRPAIEEAEGIYAKADLRGEEAKETYDRKKLLELGFYDKASLAECEKGEKEGN